MLVGPVAPWLRAAEQAIDLDGNSANGAESTIVTRVLQAYPVKIENVIFNNASGQSFYFVWDGAGPGGFRSLVTAGPGVGTKWEWTTISQVYSILSPAAFEPSPRGLPVFGAKPVGVRGGSDGRGTFVVPGKSIFPTQVTVSSASLTSSLVTFFSPEQTVATCGGSYAPGRWEQTITNTSGGTVELRVEQPNCCPEPSMTLCEDGCQFYLTDVNNCGGCGIECALDEFCSEGACEPICPSGQTLCGETCLDLQTDASNCGACGSACDPFYRCTDGTCEPDCPPGDSLCGDTCVDLQTDASNCGACGTECGAVYLCSSGTCEPNCPPGETVCGQACFDLLTDEAHCGACGAACDPLYRCTAGACEPDCPPGQILCGSVCLDPLTDQNHCGGCGIVCDADEFCGAGTCQPICPGQTLCGDTCADLQSDPLNCGSCGNACGSNQICTSGGCMTCRPPRGTACNNQCVNTHTDPFNCGGCGNVCDFSNCPSIGQGTCSQGSSCICAPAPLTTGSLLPFEPVPRSAKPAPTSTGNRARAERRGIPEASLERPLVRERARGRDASVVARATRAAAATTVLEAPVCDVTPVQQVIPPGGSYTQCRSGGVVGKEVFTIATVQQEGQPIAQGPCSLIVPAPEVEIPSFLPSPVAVFVEDASGDGLCQPGETCELLVRVQNLGGSALFFPVGTLTSQPDGFNPLPVTFTGDTSAYPDFPAFLGGGDCDTPPELDPRTNVTAFSLILPPEQEPDVGRVFQLRLMGDQGTPIVADMRFVLGVGKLCNPATDINGETYDGLSGFLTPVDAPLVPEGNPVRYSPSPFNQNKTIPLKIQLQCGGQIIGSEGIDPNPEIVSLVHETLGPQPLVNINGDNGANPNDPLFGCGSSRCEYQLRTRDLPIGVYVISVRMPDSRVFQAGFTIRP